MWGITYNRNHKKACHHFLFLALETSNVCPSYADQQFGTNCHRICETKTLGTSLNVSLRAGYLSVRTAGGESDRH